MQSTAPAWVSIVAAAVGAVIGLIAGVVAWGLKARSDLRQWHRQNRLNAYEALTTSLNYLAEALRTPQEPEKAGLESAPEGIQKGLYEVTQAIGVVKLVGTDPVRAPTAALDSWVRNATNFLMGYTAAQKGQLPVMAGELDVLCAKFTTAAKNDAG